MFDLSEGQVVADKYRVERVIGSGGMGVVVSATHIELDQPVALKFLRNADAEGLVRFQREARLIVRLKSPHVARVFDVGSIDDETPYIVMELLEGEDLARVVDQRVRLEVEEAVDWVLQACEAVAEAHALGMVHRDLKPANLFLARGPGGTSTIKVLDFGISKSLHDRVLEGTNGGLTNEGVALGSPGYMSPEQMTSSRDVDARTDIYSLGAILYKLAGGQNPYKGNSLMSILTAMATSKVPPLRSIVPTVPEAFSAVVERCLAQDPAARPASLAELAHAIAPFGSRRAQASAEQIAATLGADPRITTGDLAPVLGVARTRHVGAPPQTPPHRRPEAGLPSDGAPLPAGINAPPASVTATAASDTFGATIVNPLATPAPAVQSSTVPLGQQIPSYPPPMERSETVPAKHRQAAGARSVNFLVALGGAAILTGALAWAAFAPSLSPTPRPVLAEPPPAMTPAPTPPAATMTAAAVTQLPVVIAPPAIVTPDAGPEPARPAPKKPGHHPAGTGHKPHGATPPNLSDMPGGRL